MTKVRYYDTNLRRIQVGGSIRTFCSLGGLHRRGKPEQEKRIYRVNGAMGKQSVMLSR